MSKLISGRAYQCSAFLLINLLALPLKGFAHSDLPMGLHPLDWHNPQVNQVMSTGDSGEIGSTAYTTIIDGKQCMVGKALYVDILDDYAFDIDEQVELEIEFDLSNSSTNILFTYDKNLPIFVSDGSFASGGYREKITLPTGNNNQRWFKKRMVLERARFAGLGPYNHSDFFIGSADASPITVCSIKLNRHYRTPIAPNPGRLSITTQNSRGQTLPVRMGLYDQSGRLPLPGTGVIYQKSFTDIHQVAEIMPIYGGAWPAKNRQMFYTDGDYQTQLPPGRYDLVISRGMEYRFIQQQVEIKPGKETRLTIELERWTNMPAKGWYSGDTHVHSGRSGPRDDYHLVRQMMAEDLHVTSTLSYSTNLKRYFQHYDWSPIERQTDLLYSVVPGYEGPRTARLGHAGQLNLSGPTPSFDQYFLYHNVFDAVAKAGGIRAYFHLNEEVAPYFNSAGGMAMDMPFGLVDVIEIMDAPVMRDKTPSKPWVSEVWFDFLNLGYRLAPIAGTDYMGMGIPAGASRTYVHLPQKFSVPDWFNGLKVGNSFVTSGPLLELSVNGKPPGTVLDLEPKASIHIEAQAHLLPDLGRLTKLELYEQGELIARVASDQTNESLTLTHNTNATRGSWFVLLAYGDSEGKPSLHAATAPVYISVKGGGSCKPEAIATIVSKMKDRMAAALDGRYKEYVSWNTSEWDDAQKAAVEKRILAATERYKKMAAEAEAGRCWVKSEQTPASKKPSN